jgi:hypothetical protein
MTVTINGCEDIDFKASGRILLRLSKESSMFSYITFTRTPRLLNKFYARSETEVLRCPKVRLLVQVTRVKKNFISLFVVFTNFLIADKKTIGEDVIVAEADDH